MPAPELDRAEWLLRIIATEIQRRRIQVNSDPTIREVIVAIEFPRGPEGVGSIRVKYEGERMAVK